MRILANDAVYLTESASTFFHLKFVSKAPIKMVTSGAALSNISFKHAASYGN